MSRAAHLARVRTAHNRVAATSRIHVAALDRFAERVNAAREAGVPLSALAAELGVHPTTIRQKCKESKARQEKREASP